MSNPHDKTATLSPENLLAAQNVLVVTERLRDLSRAHHRVVEKMNGDLAESLGLRVGGTFNDGEEEVLIHSLRIDMDVIRSLDVQVVAKMDCARPLKGGGFHKTARVRRRVNFGTIPYPDLLAGTPKVTVTLSALGGSVEHDAADLIRALTPESKAT